MDSSDEEVLLESCCFLFNHHQEQIKSKKKTKKEKHEGTGNIKKRIEQGVYHNVNDRESNFRLFV